jgi:hypothetical protein
MLKKSDAFEQAYRQVRDFAEDRRDWTRMVISDEGLHPNYRLVGVAVGLRTNHRTEQSFPSTKTIAVDVSVSVRTVIRAINALEARGHLKITRRKRGVNRYEMVLPWK